MVLLFGLEQWEELRSSGCSCTKAGSEMAAAMAAPQVAALHWFRKGLRLHDNPSLLRAIEGAVAVGPALFMCVL
jgi:hypothetical protein